MSWPGSSEACLRLITGDFGEIHGIVGLISDTTFWVWLRLEKKRGT